MTARDPYHDEKVYHYAAKMNADGGVSALCFVKPRAIDLTRALWTIREGAVTCPKCKRELRSRALQPSREKQGDK